MYDLADQSSTRTERKAARLAAAARREGDREAEALSWRAAALAARSRDVSEARKYLARGLAVAHADGLDEVEARLRVTEAGIDVLAGRHDEARVILSTIAARTGGRAVTEALSQLGVLHLLAGDYRSAIECLDGAIGVLGVEGIWAANAWSNRGLARAYMGDLATAEHDLAQAIEVFGELGSRQAVAEVRQNLGWVRDQAGDYVGALESFTAADMVLADTPASRGYLLRDRANTLMAVGLVVDAVEDAAASVAAFESAGRDGDAAESRIVEASALILLDDRVRATEVAEQARASFVAQGRPIYADHAHLISLPRRHAGGRHRGQSIRSAPSCIEPGETGHGECRPRRATCPRHGCRCGAGTSMRHSTTWNLRAGAAARRVTTCACPTGSWQRSSRRRRVSEQRH